MVELNKCKTDVLLYLEEYSFKMSYFIQTLITSYLYYQLQNKNKLNLTNIKF